MPGNQRVFILSPASTSGKRAQLLLNPAQRFELAQRVHRPAGAPVGEVFSFLSGLYFRGKLAYAMSFANPGSAIHVITSDRGMLPPDAPLNVDDLRAMSSVPIDPAHEPYRTALTRDANAINESLRGGGEVILLGSIATDKYVSVLADVFGAQLMFPAEFVGRGDMSRGGMMLRAAREARELTYTTVIAAARRGRRPPKL